MSITNLSRCSDEELLQRGVGDPCAFGEFYDRYENLLLLFFQRQTGRPDLAADLAAEVFAVALVSLPKFRAELGSARGWLFGIARHELAQMWRKGRVEAEARRRLGMEPIMLSHDDLERIEQLSEVEGIDSLALLDALPDDQRAAILGRVIDEREYDELARALDCSELVVRQRVSRGLRALRSLVSTR